MNLLNVDRFFKKSLDKPILTYSDPMSVREMNHSLARQVEMAHHRVNRLCENAEELSQHPSQVLIECLEELQTSLEELQVAEAELRQQNEQLIEARHFAEMQQQRYQELFDFAPDGYLVTDLYGRVQEANHAATFLLNLPQKYLIGKLLVNFVPEADRRAFRSILNQLPTVHRVQEWEVTWCRRQDNSVSMALTVETVRDQEGQAIGLRWLMRDITARKQAEAQLRQTQLQNLQLIEADRLKSQFMATISHELRTPMNSILGFAELLLRRLRQKGDASLCTLIDPILRNSRHLLNLIESLLDFSRLQAHRLDLRLEMFDLNELVTSIVQELQALADQKALDLGVHLPEGNLTIVNDRVRLRQILVNLLSNAIKFTETGSVMLEVREVQKDRMLIVVSDTGIGISPADQSHLFREFWQANQTLTRHHEGVGLGLSITRNLVELMQGDITVESRLGEGSRFRVELPRYVRQA